MSKSKRRKTSENQRASWRRWAKAHPEEYQARKDAWAKSPAGRAWLKKNQKKKNAARKAWRARKKAEAQRIKNGG